MQTKETETSVYMCQIWLLDFWAVFRLWWANLDYGGPEALLPFVLAPSLLLSFHISSAVLPLGLIARDTVRNTIPGS